MAGPHLPSGFHCGCRCHSDACCSLENLQRWAWSRCYKMFFSSLQIEFSSSKYHLGNLCRTFCCLDHRFLLGLCKYLSMDFALKIILIIICTLMLLSINWVFVLQSRYSNTVLATIRNALIFSAIHFVDSALMLVMLMLPIVLLLWQPSTVPFILICGFTLSGITRAAFYNRIFIRHESALEDKWAYSTDRSYLASRASRGLDAILGGFRTCGIPLKLAGQHPRPFNDFSNRLRTGGAEKNLSRIWELRTVKTDFDSFGVVFFV